MKKSKLLMTVISGLLTTVSLNVQAAPNGGKLIPHHPVGKGGNLIRTPRQPIGQGRLPVGHGGKP